MTVKNYFYVLLFAFLSLKGISQTNENSKADYRWIIGNKTDRFHAIFNFNSAPISVDTSQSITSFDFANASICDADGNFLFFTNGLKIVDKSFKIMAGGKRISPSNFLDQYLDVGVPIIQFAIALPWPKSDLLIGLFHSDCFVVTKPNQYTTLMAYRSFLTTIDRIGDSGNGSVAEANTVIFQDSLNPGNITACRHANGRDWWVLNVGNHNNKHIIRPLQGNFFHYNI